MRRTNCGSSKSKRTDINIIFVKIMGDCVRAGDKWERGQSWCLIPDQDIWMWRWGVWGVWGRWDWLISHHHHQQTLPIIITHLQPPLSPSFSLFLSNSRPSVVRAIFRERSAKFGLLEFYCDRDLLSERWGTHRPRPNYNQPSWSQKCLSLLYSAILIQKWLESSHEVKIRNIYSYFKVRNNY